MFGKENKFVRCEIGVATSTLFALALILVVVGCGPDEGSDAANATNDKTNNIVDDSKTADDTATDDATNPATDDATNDAVVDISDVELSVLSLEELQSHIAAQEGKVVVVDLWALW
jgi:hypothetical protein